METVRPTLLVEDTELAVDMALVEKRKKTLMRRMKVARRETNQVLTSWRKKQQSRTRKAEWTDPDPYDYGYIFYIPHGLRVMSPALVQKFRKEILG